MKVGLLGAGFGIARAPSYHSHPQVSSVVVVGRTPAKLPAVADEFGCATTTEVASIYHDPAVDLVDVWLPTGLHAEHALRALGAGRHVLCERSLAATMADAHRVVDAPGGQRPAGLPGHGRPLGSGHRGPARRHRPGPPRPPAESWRWSCAARCWGRATRSGWTRRPWTCWTAAWTPSSPPWPPGVGGRPGVATGPRREVDLPAGDAYGAVIDPVLACGQGREVSRLSPASVLDALQLTLEVHAALAGVARSRGPSRRSPMDAASLLDLPVGSELACPAW